MPVKMAVARTREKSSGKDCASKSLVLRLCGKQRDADARVLVAERYSVTASSIVAQPFPGFAVFTKLNFPKSIFIACFRSACSNERVDVSFEE